MRQQQRLIATALLEALSLARELPLPRAEDVSPMLSVLHLLQRQVVFDGLVDSGLVGQRAIAAVQQQHECGVIESEDTSGSAVLRQQHLDGVLFCAGD